ncbi:MAG: regulatory protein RecX [bacterium]
MTEEEKINAKKDAYRLISYRERSEQELIERLLEKGHNLNIINSIIPRIKELGYLDDRRFAEMWVSHKIKHAPRGKNMLKKELQDKGVDSSLIDNVLNDKLTYQIELEMGRKLAKKWLNRNGNKKNKSLKIKRYLFNKGFVYDIIDEIVNSFFE